MPLPTPGSTALSHLRICDLTGPARRRGRDPVPRRVRRPGDPGRGPGAPGNVGHPARRPALRRRPARHRPRRRVQQPQRREARDHDRPPQERGKELLRRLVAVSDAVTENFAAGVFARMGFSYDELARDQARHRLRVELRLRRRAARTRRTRPGARSCRRSAGSPSAAGSPTSRPRAGASPTWTTWAPTTWRWRSSPGWSTATAPARASGSTWRAPRRASRCAGPTSSTTR